MSEGQPTTLNELFSSAVARLRDRECLRFKTAGEWQSLTFGEAGRRAREMALGLDHLGIGRGDRVAIWSENRPEWTLADLACLSIGAVDVPIYATQSVQQVEYILNDAAVRAIFVSSAFLPDVLRLTSCVPSIEFVFCFDGSAQAAEQEHGLNERGLNERGLNERGLNEQ